MTATDSEVVREAGRLIEERGLAKQVLMDLDGKLCAVGAVLYALTPDKEHTEVSLGLAFDNVAIEDQFYRIITGLANKLVTDPRVASYEVVRWNNQLERTQEEVVKTLYELATELSSAHPTPR